MSSKTWSPLDDWNTCKCAVKTSSLKHHLVPSGQTTHPALKYNYVQTSEARDFPMGLQEEWLWKSVWTCNTDSPGIFLITYFKRPAICAQIKAWIPHLLQRPRRNSRAGWERGAVRRAIGNRKKTLVPPRIIQHGLGYRTWNIMQLANSWSWSPISQTYWCNCELFDRRV